MVEETDTSKELLCHMVHAMIEALVQGDKQAQNQHTNRTRRMNKGLLEKTKSDLSFW